jgi:hypothetical protein
LYTSRRLRGERRYSSTFNMGTRVRWVVSFTPGRFITGESTRGTHWREKLKNCKYISERSLISFTSVESFANKRHFYPRTIMQLIICLTCIAETLLKVVGFTRWTIKKRKNVRPNMEYIFHVISTVHVSASTIKQNLLSPGTSLSQ